MWIPLSFFHLSHKYNHHPVCIRNCWVTAWNVMGLGPYPRGSCGLVGEAEINHIITEVNGKRQQVGRKWCAATATTCSSLRTTNSESVLVFPPHCRNQGLEGEPKQIKMHVWACVSWSEERRWWFLPHRNVDRTVTIVARRMRGTTEVITNIITTCVILLSELQSSPLKWRSRELTCRSSDKDSRLPMQRARSGN